MEKKSQGLILLKLGSAILSSAPYLVHPASQLWKKWFNSSGWRPGSVGWRFPRQLQIWNSSVCRMLNMTLCWLEYLQVQSLQAPESLFLFVVRWILTRFSKPLFINQWIFKGKLNLKPVQKPLCNVPYYTNFYFCQSLMSTSMNILNFLFHKGNYFIYTDGSIQ